MLLVVILFMEISCLRTVPGMAIRTCATFASVTGFLMWPTPVASQRCGAERASKSSPLRVKRAAVVRLLERLRGHFEIDPGGLSDEQLDAPLRRDEAGE